MLCVYDITLLLYRLIDSFFESQKEVSGSQNVFLVYRNTKLAYRNSLLESQKDN